MGFWDHVASSVVSLVATVVATAVAHSVAPAVEARSITSLAAFCLVVPCSPSSIEIKSLGTFTSSGERRNSIKHKGDF